jgi:hypothetical protein
VVPGGGCGGDGQIALDDRLAFGGAIGIEFDPGKLIRGHRRQPAEDQDRAEIGEHRRPQRIERLGEGQPAVRGLGLAEQRDQRIGYHLDDHHPAGEHEQRQQEHAVGCSLAGGNEQQAAHHHRQQARHRAAHVADPLDQPRARDPDHRISGEEAELHQHCLRVVEREQLLQLGNDHVVETGDPAEDEEQPHHEIP